MDLERRAERQDGLIRASDAVASLSKRQIAKRKQQGIWRSPRRGVVAINGSPRSWRQEVRAVVLSCGPGVAASHATALRLWGVDVPIRLADGIHVSGRLNRMVRLDGVDHHRSGSFEPDDLVERWGIACTSPVRTLIDVSSSLRIDELGTTLDELMRRGLVDLEHLRDRVMSMRPAPGRSIKKLKIVLSGRLRGFDAGESALETRIARVMAKGGIRPPVQQHPVVIGGRRYRLDFAWPDRKIFLEGNGFGFHSMASDLDRDARRQNALVIDGWTPIELTWRMTDAEMLATLRSFGLAP